MRKIIVGRIKDKSIDETIDFYQENIPEQILTAQKNIRDKFADAGYNPEEVVFD